MIARRQIITFILPLILFGGAIGLLHIALFVYNMPSHAASKRSDATYSKIITSAAPDMLNTFTVKGVEIKNKHWVVVEIANKQNNDTLRTLLYDPSHAATHIQVVVPPSKRVVLDSFMTEAWVKLPQKETNNATE